MQVNCGITQHHLTFFSIPSHQAHRCNSNPFLQYQLFFFFSHLASLARLLCGLLHDQLPKCSSFRLQNSSMVPWCAAKTWSLELCETQAKNPKKQTTAHPLHHSSTLFSNIKQAPVSPRLFFPISYTKTLPPKQRTVSRPPKNENTTKGKRLKNRTRKKEKERHMS